MNGHIGKRGAGDDKVMGVYGVGEKNSGGDRIVEFASSMNMTILNTYYKKADRHKMTYKCGGRTSQVDNTLCRREGRKEVRDCTVILGECMTSQHRPVICKLEIRVDRQMKKGKCVKTKWWNLKK